MRRPTNDMNPLATARHRASRSGALCRRILILALLALPPAQLVAAGTLAQPVRSPSENGVPRFFDSPVHNAGELVRLIDRAVPDLRRHAGIDPAPPRTSAAARRRQAVVHDRMIRAAHYGYPNAQYNLARLLLQGTGRPSDAAEWLQRSAERGYMRAQILLGYLALRVGTASDGTPDLVRAELWWWAAELQDDPLARDFRKKLAPLLGPRDVSSAHRLKSEYRTLLPLLPRTVSGSPLDRSETNSSFRTAAAAGDVKRLLDLLVLGADADSQDSEGRTAMINAAWRGHAPIVKILLDRGSDVEIADNHRFTPLIWAAVNGQGKVLTTLLDAGADPGRADRDGIDALMRAAWNGHLDIVDRLLKSGADTARQDAKGLSALDYAKREGHKRIVARLQSALPVR